MSQGWYSVNNLSVTNNSAIVTGTGTQFATFVHSGFGIEIEGVVYQVQSADSATQITLAQPYRGATKANASYNVFPTKGLEIQAHQDVIELIDTFGPLRNGIGELDAQVIAATTKADQAAASAATATTKASEAATSAGTANTRATAAQASATTASGHATTASNAKTAAESARDLAAGYASDANTSKVAAAGSATSAANSLTATNTAKTAAETARDGSVNAKTASEAARNAAQLAKGAAEDAAALATTKRNEAEGFKNTAGTSATTATTKANDANLSAIAAAASAQDAEDYKDDAETAKNAAVVAKGDAETARNTTLTYRNAAEGFRDTAGSHATNAELAALRAENAADTAENYVTEGAIETALGFLPVSHEGAKEAGLNINSTFKDQLNGWYSNNTESAAVAASRWQSAFDGHQNVYVNDTGARQNIFTGLIDIVPTRKYRIRARVYSSDAASTIRFGLRCADASGISVGWNGGASYPQVLSNTPLALGWSEIISDVFTGTGGNDTTQATNMFYPNTKKVNVLCYNNFGNLAGATQAIDYLYLEDITDIADYADPELAKKANLTGATFSGNLSAINYYMEHGGRMYSTATGAYFEATGTNNRMLFDNTNKMWRFYIDGLELLSVRENQVVSPLPYWSDAAITSGNHLTNKTYVDSALATKAGTAVATTSANGLMSAADKTKLNGITLAGTSGGSVNTVPQYGTGGVLTVAAPTANGHASTKAYVDTGLATKAGTTSASTTVAGLMSAADKSKLDGIATGAQVNTVTSVAGKTGVVALVKADVGLSNVDNTTDASKPVSTAQQTALNAKLTKAGDTFTGGFSRAITVANALTGTSITPDSTTSNWFTYTNAAAFTLNAPTSNNQCTIMIEITNAASGMGAMTASGFDFADVSAMTTTANAKFIATIAVFGSGKKYLFVAKASA